MRDAKRPRPGRDRAVVTLLSLIAWAVPTAGQEAASGHDDLVFRPTVVVRQANGQGSGTIIASVPGETLVLTAAHVVGDAEGGPPSVDVHRYNLGLERTSGPDGWPVRLAAELAASDPEGDVAVVRVRGKRALPYVGRLAPIGEEAKAGAVVTSVGIDGGDHLSSWMTRVAENSWFAMLPVDDGPGVSGPLGRYSRDGRPPARPTRTRGPDDLAAAERPFLTTGRPPRHGRSGGGLFDTQGRLVGLCVGRIDGGPERGRGVFASVESVRRLLRENELDEVVARSERERLTSSRPR